MLLPTPMQRKREDYRQAFQHFGSLIGRQDIVRVRAIQGKVANATSMLGMLPEMDRAIHRTTMMVLRRQVMSKSPGVSVIHRT